MVRTKERHLSLKGRNKTVMFFVDTIFRLVRYLDCSREMPEMSMWYGDGKCLELVRCAYRENDTPREILQSIFMRPLTTAHVLSTMDKLFSLYFPLNSLAYRLAVVTLF